MTHAHRARTGDLLGGRYRLDDCLDEGHDATVYRATDRDRNEPAVVHLLEMRDRAGRHDAAHLLLDELTDRLADGREALRTDDNPRPLGLRDWGRTGDDLVYLVYDPRELPEATPAAPLAARLRRLIGAADAVSDELNHLLEPLFDTRSEADSRGDTETTEDDSDLAETVDSTDGLASIDAAGPNDAVEADAPTELVDLSGPDSASQAPTAHVDVSGTTDTGGAPSEAPTEHADPSPPPPAGGRVDVGETETAGRAEADRAPTEDVDTASLAEEPVKNGSASPPRSSPEVPQAADSAGSPPDAEASPAAHEPEDAGDDTPADDRFRSGRWQDVVRNTIGELSLPESSEGDEEDQGLDRRRMIAIAVVAGAVVGVLLFVTLLVLVLITVFG